MQTNAESIILAKRIAQSVVSFGGRAYYVGGFVRDRLLGIENKDIDIEVHGITPEKLEEILSEFGELITIGNSFGVYGIRGYGLDIAMPRKETVTGKGHKDFDISVDPFIGTLKAALRRDFTVNAMMQDVITGEIIDHFNGREDLKNRIIRHVSDKSFSEDALRVLRCAQFSARFEFAVDEKTATLCKSIDLSTLPSERVFEELKKAVLKADKPSLFFEALRKMNQLAFWFPEVEALIGVEQPTRHHSEGDVWNHTMAVLDEAAALREDVTEKTAFMLSALCHDFGKAVSTTNENGVIHAIGHEVTGKTIARRFVNRLTQERKIVKYVTNMVEMHMKPNNMASDKSSIKATNKMFDASVCPSDLISLASCDNKGSKPLYDRPSRVPFLQERLAIYNEYMSRPFVKGADLIDSGIEPSSDFSDVLAYAHKMRLAGVDKDSALKQTIIYAKRRRSKK